MSLSPLKPKFLLDENVKKRVARFLSSEGFDVMIAPKGVSNGKLAALSKFEKHVLVTNDSDFANPILFPKEKIFSVVLFEIPQDKPKAFVSAFSNLLKKKSKLEDFEGYLIVLKEEDFEVSPILSVKTFTK